MSRKQKDRIEETAEQLPPETEPVQEQTDPEEGAAALEAELGEAKKKVEEYLDMAQRVQADFDNFRRRNAQARTESYEEGARDMIKLILPVVDNLERAMEAQGDEGQLKEGVGMTLRQLLEILSKRGVEVISRQGEPFDPRYENAVMNAPADQGEPGTVLQVFQKGYRMGETVLRHAMVQVVSE